MRDIRKRKYIIQQFSIKTQHSGCGYILLLPSFQILKQNWGNSSTITMRPGLVCLR